MKEERQQGRHKRSADRFATPRIWSFLWRGAVGGILGVFMIVGVAIYKNPINVLGLEWLPTFILLGGITGLFVGVMMFLLSRLFRRRLGMTWRVILGTMLTSVVIGIYLFLSMSFKEDGSCVNCLSNAFRQGFRDDPRGFIVKLVFIAFLVGGLAGAFAKGKRQNQELT